MVERGKAIYQYDYSTIIIALPSWFVEERRGLADPLPRKLRGTEVAMGKAFLLFLAVLTPTVRAWGYCNDNDVSCANWAKAGECEKDHVKKLCPHSCSICIHNCRDSDESCPQWGSAGECDSNFDFMAKSCPVTCGVCKTRCYDKDAMCPEWARAGECAKNSDMYVLCPVSCGTCTDMCLDKQNDCPRWAADGACGSNPAYMLKECPHSCQVCFAHILVHLHTCLSCARARIRCVTRRVTRNHRTRCHTTHRPMTAGA